MHKILLSGYYGYNNAGDEAILKSIIGNIKTIDESAKITVLSDNIEFSKAKYGINAVKRFNPFHLLSAIIDCDILISGGGTLFQDKTSTRSLVYYTSVINTAKLLGKKVMIYANGIGPLRKPSNIKRVKRAIENADIITLRDKEALNAVLSMNIKGKEIYMTTDPVFSLKENSVKVAENLLSNHSIYAGENFVVVSVRSWDNDDEISGVFAKACDYINAKYGKKIVFLPLQYPNDINAIENVTKKMKKSCTIIKDITPQDMMSIIKKSSYVFAMRLHALIFAANVGTPMISYSYDDKVENLMKQIKMPYNCNKNSASFEQIKSHIDEIEQNYDKIKAELVRNTMSVKDLAQKNLDYMRKIIES